MKIAIAGGTGTVGRYVRLAAQEKGYETVVISRRSGHDVETGEGLRDALSGVEALIDVTSVGTTSARRAVEFFRRVTRNLQAAGRDASVRHLIALSIAGIDGLDASYYAGKLAQEEEVSTGPLPWSVLRASQFHEFAEQVLIRGSIGRLAAVPKALIRPVAAREVGRRLIEVAEAGPSGRVRDFTGPKDERLIEMVRRLLAHDGIRRPAVEIALPGKYWRGTASGVLRGSPLADRGSVTFDEWLRTDHRVG